MTRHYANFGFPNTVCLPLAGFDLEDFSPVDGVLERIIIDSPSENLGIRCLINEIQILPEIGEITIRTAIAYPIERKVTQKDRLVVALDNHDGINTHTPSIVFQVEKEEISREVKKV